MDLNYKPKNCKEIVQKYLLENGYDGLYCEEQCGCSLDDFIPCGEDCMDCIPAYKIYCKNCSLENCEIKRPDGYCFNPNQDKEA